MNLYGVEIIIYDGEAVEVQARKHKRKSNRRWQKKWLKKFGTKTEMRGVIPDGQIIGIKTKQVTMNSKTWESLKARLNEKIKTDIESMYNERERILLHGYGPGFPVFR